MKKTILFIAAALALAPLARADLVPVPATADPILSPDKTLGGTAATPEPATRNLELYRAHELDIDLAGTYTAAEPRGLDHVFDTNARHGVYGGYLGVTYWATRNFGSGFTAGIRDLNNPNSLLVDYTTVHIDARLPIGRLAPYGRAELGRSFADGGYFTKVDAGAEYRFTPNIAAFGQGGFTWQYEQMRDTSEVDAGIRFAF